MKNIVTEHRANLVERIVEKMESGKLKWLRPWNYPELQLPFNPITGTRYSGINVAYLLMEAEDQGYTDPRWLTFAQAKKRGLHIKGEAHGSKVEFWSVYAPRQAEGEVADNQQTRAFCKLYTVFNGSQIEGLESLDVNSHSSIENFQKNERCERIMSGCGVRIQYGCREASYSFNLGNPSDERIRMPNREWFKDASHFYATVLHEIGHSTGNPLRLDRKMGAPLHSRAYALEELRVELASAFMLLDLRLSLDDEGMEQHLQQHAAYIQFWRAVATDSPQDFIIAIREAHKIANTVLAYGEQLSSVCGDRRS